LRQLLQKFTDGQIRLVDVPVPSVSGVQVLVATHASLISAGTERALVQFGRASMLEKARSQPDRVRDVIDKARTDGVMQTIDAVRSKLGDPVTLGYCSAGVVVETGAGVTRFHVGDRVVTNGSHGEYTRVPHTLAARIPDNVDFSNAAFTPVAAIAMQGVRLAQPALGETVVVYGLGLIGLIAVQLLRAAGCSVIGIDPDPGRLELAAQFGATVLHSSDDALERKVLEATDGAGADAVLLTLASESHEPVHRAAVMSRKRGRIVLVGVTGLNLRRDDFYRKELSFTVSCSYGPGRYDPSYEEGGTDYPVGYVRWTQQRNFEAVLSMMGDGRLDVRPLITHRLPFERAAEAYNLVTGSEPSLGVVLDYPDAAGASLERTVRIARTAAPGSTEGATRSQVTGDPGIAGVIGTGAFAQRVLMPALLRAGFKIRSTASSGGTSAAIAAERAGAEVATSSVNEVLRDPAIGTVFIATRHDTHGALALSALEAGKHVFVEKPLALAEDELDRLEAAAAASDRLLTVGFNRRFAPLTRELRAATAGRAGPLSLVITVNAGAIPRDHWTQHPQMGGGRIAGEGCHFIDLARALVGAAISGGSATAAAARGVRIDDITHIVLEFEDGSTAAIHYLASGARSFPKERVEAFADGRTFVIDNWRRMRSFGSGGSPGVRRGLRRLLRPAARQDKGHDAEVEQWYRAVTGSAPAPIPLPELLEVSRWTLRLAALARGE
jgi:predicted dehydrogenase